MNVSKYTTLYLSLLLLYLLPFTNAVFASPLSPELAISKKKANLFFLNSVSRALNESINSKHPIQVNLYILSHFLLYNPTLRFTDEATSKELEHQIIKYFSENAPEDYFKEGCLAIKLLIATINTPTYKEFHSSLEKKYFSFVTNQWNNDGVGECFINSISRSYGNDFKKLECTGKTQELTAKTAYYILSSSKEAQDINFSYLNDSEFFRIKNWWNANTYAWTIDIALLDKDHHFVTHKRQDEIIQQTKAALEAQKYDTLTGALLVYIWLKYKHEANSYVDIALQKIYKSQASNGAIPSSIKDPKKSEHNFDATPTYLYLLALHEYEKVSTKDPQKN